MFKDYSDMRGILEQRYLTRADCPALNELDISLCGLTTARRHYATQGLTPPFSELVFSLEGTGEAWVNDQWVPLRPGDVYLSAVMKPRGFRTQSAKSWRHAWIHMRQQPGREYFDIEQPRIIRADGRELGAALDLLFTETTPNRDLRAISPLIQLIGLYLRRAMTGFPMPDALAHVWTKVEQNPAHPWSLDQLAREAGESREQLRLHCQEILKISPMAQVARIRIQRAAALLDISDAKIMTIASAVGYHSLPAFIIAFKRHTGKTPAQYRLRSQP